MNYENRLILASPWASAFGMGMSRFFGSRCQMRRLSAQRKSGRRPGENINSSRGGLAAVMRVGALMRPGRGDAEHGRAARR